MGKNLKGKECGKGICQRKDGLYSARFLDRFGNRKVRYFGSVVEAKNWLEDARYEDKHADTVMISDTEMTVEDWFNFWIGNIVSDLAPNTIRNYRERYEHNIRPVIGKLKITDVKPMHCKLVFNRMNETYAGGTIRQTYIAMGTMFRAAVDNDILIRHPMDGVKYTKPMKAADDIKYFTVDEQKAFLETAKSSHNYHQFALILETGLRVGEVIGLTWDCIDWDTSNIHLYRQLKPVKGRKDTWAFTTLKNKQSRDFIAPPSVICILKKQKLRQTEWKLQYGTAYNNDLNLVFTNPLGKHLTSVTIYNHFKAIVTEMGLPEVRFHDLRHTYATLALQNGVDVKTVSNNLGHATVAFTMDKYVHVSMTMQKDCVSKMESFIASL